MTSKIVIQFKTDLKTQLLISIYYGLKNLTWKIKYHKHLSPVTQPPSLPLYIPNLVEYFTINAYVHFLFFEY